MVLTPGDHLTHACVLRNDMETHLQDCIEIKMQRRDIEMGEESAMDGDDHESASQLRKMHLPVASRTRNSEHVQELFSLRVKHTDAPQTLTLLSISLEMISKTKN